MQAEAMIYNEYAQVLEATNPATGQLYKPEDLNVIDYNNEGTAMLQDAIFARAAWLAQGTNADVATRFLRASFKGWIFCRDNAAKCVDYTTAAGSTLGKGHQAWMMNEINPLIWPSPNGIGQLDPTLWKQTVDVAIGAGVIKAAPPDAAFRTDLAKKALEGITDDIKGADFKKGTVTVTPKGERSQIRASRAAGAEGELRRKGDPKRRPGGAGSFRSDSVKPTPRPAAKYRKGNGRHRPRDGRPAGHRRTYDQPIDRPRPGRPPGNARSATAVRWPRF